ncbi:MAG: sphingosine kinase, partial [Agromyces sp.]
LTLFPKVFSGAHIGHPLVTEIRGTHFRIDTPDVIAYADGERLGPLPVSVSVVPGAAKVFAPL